jgi:hypothetical protein
VPIAAGQGIGSLPIAGAQQTGSSNSLTISPGVGSIILTGFAPTVTMDVTISPGVGAVTITGFSPTVTNNASGALTVNPGVGAVTITGFAPSVLIGMTVSPGLGGVTITGFAPTVTNNSGSLTVSPGAGSVVLTSFAPTISGQITPIISPIVGSGNVFYAMINTPGTTVWLADWSIAAFNVNVQVYIPAGVTVSYEIDFTLDDLNSQLQSPPPVEWTTAATFPVGSIGTTASNFTAPVQALRLNVASITGGVIYLKIIQPFFIGT